MSAFSFRPLRAADIPNCIALLRAEGARGELLDARLLARLLAERRVIARAFEETTAAGHRVLRGCGLSALVAPQAALTAMHGGALDPVDAALRSCRTPTPHLLDRGAIAPLNRARRLYMLVLDFALDGSAGAPAAAVTALAHRAFLQAHSGYGLRALLAVVRPWERKADGYRASLAAMGCSAAPAAADGSQVFTLAAEQIADQPFHLLQTLFVARAPRLVLTPAQQELLELAALGFDDAAIARELAISLHTVHKRWRAIYERASAAYPGLAAGAPYSGGTGGRRGLEKRRLIVEYVRAHPEELRPYPRRGTAS